VQKSFSLNYLKIYLWQGLAMAMNIGSMVIVTPKLASSPGIYGIYALCIGATIFLQYADIGFVGAAHKYASESYARKDMAGEIRVIGFATFILLMFVIAYVVCISFFSFQPALLIKNLHDHAELRIASQLLIILAAFAPVTIMQRFLQLVFGVRVEDYIYQRLSLVSGVVRIASVYYFFAPGHYDIVGYFFLYQSVSLLLLIASILIAKRRYAYDFPLLFRSIRFSRPEYLRMKNLAFSSLYTTLIWVVFFELDLFAIGKLLGPKMVAMYALGFTLLGVLRGLFGTLYSPFTARFNHFRGLGLEEELKAFFLRIIVITMPFVVFPILSIAALRTPFLLSWVGPEYAGAAPLLLLLLLSYIYGFVSYPTSILIMARERMRTMNLVSTIVVVVFWAGIFLTYDRLQTVSFALFKFIGFSMFGIFYAYSAARFLGLDWMAFLRKVLAPILVPSLALTGALSWVAGFLPMEKGKAHLFLTIGTGACGSAMALALYYGFSRPFREAVNVAAGKALRRFPSFNQAPQL
jgi:O-antigen/teichoic acid export membrane protein